MVRKSLLVLALAAGLGTVPLAAGSAGAASPAIIDIGTGLTVRDVSGRGVVVGDAAQKPSDAFFKWSNGRLTTYGRLGAVSASRAVAVNRSGAMALWTTFDTSVRFQDGKARDLGSLVKPPNETLAIDMNDAGVIVGASVGPDFNWHAFTWAKGKIADLGGLGGTYSAAVAVNNSGQTLGVSFTPTGEEHTVIWQHGGLTDLGTLAPGGGSGADINDKGQVVGTLTSAGGRTRAFVLTNGVLTKLPPLPGGDASYGVAINESGDVVGQSSTASGDLHAVLWRGSTVRDLGTLGGATSSAAGLSDTGLVAGTAQDANGIDHAVAWTV